MANKSSNIKERILQIAEYKGIAKEKFFEKIGMTYGNFKGKSKETPINSNAIEDIFSIFPEVSLEWLLTGQGEMIKGKITDKSGIDEELHRTEKEIIYEPTALHIARGTPLVTHEVAAGFGTSNFLIKEEDIMGRYVVPDFNGIDFMIRVKGSSMIPKYNSGDIVACRIINEKSFIQWNKTYVIATKEQGMLCKRLMPSEKKNFLRAISDNKEYPAFDIPQSEITGIALIVGVIRLE